jgi:hypothetical protein
MGLSSLDCCVARDPKHYVSLALQLAHNQPLRARVVRAASVTVAHQCRWLRLGLPRVNPCVRVVDF